jgi:hypothetical protein
MSEAILTLDTGEWDFLLDTSSNSVSIGFSNSDGGIVYFSGLRFGWTLSVDGNVIDSKEHPSSQEITYLNSDQKFISSDNFTVTLEEETLYRILVWAENDGQEYNTYVDWTKPPAPVEDEKNEEENVESGT